MSATAVPRRFRRRRSRMVLRLACAAVYFFLMLPLLVVFPLSVSSAPYLQFPPPGLSWRWYENYFGDPVWIEATVRSLGIGVATAILALLVAVPVAFSVVRGRYLGRVLIDRLAIAPMIVPSIIFSVAIYGVFAKLKLIGAWYGIALAHTVLALPFVMIVVSAGLRGFDIDQERAAIGLGASRWRAIRRVTLPQIRPSLVSAAVLAFITSFDELVVAMFLAGSQMTLPKKMFDNIRMEIDPTIASVSVLQILLIAAALVISQRFGRRIGSNATMEGASSKA
jgi:putative spermidine/putrescine transport system permease protein